MAVGGSSLDGGRRLVANLRGSAGRLTLPGIGDISTWEAGAARGGNRGLPCLQRRQHRDGLAVPAALGVLVVVVEPEAYPLLLDDAARRPGLPRRDVADAGEREPAGRTARQVRDERSLLPPKDGSVRT